MQVSELMYISNAHISFSKMRFKEYVHNNPEVPDAPAVTNTIAYLKALNKVFEKSFLGVKVRVLDLLYRGLMRGTSSS